jgi:hypothetical protein
MLSPLLLRTGAVMIFSGIAFLQAAAPGSPRLVDCPDVPGDGVLPPGPETNTQNLRVGFVAFGNFRASLVIYEDRNGMAVFQRDMILGSTASMQQNMTGNQGQVGIQGIVLSGPVQWPAATVPYEIDPALPNPTRVITAITEWTSKTSVQFTPHSTEPDYVYITVGDTCDSALGHQGGKQVIHLADGCLTPQVIHEIGHTVGLLHEHTRSDRDQYIHINWSNIPAAWQSQFRNVNPAQDVGAYDFCSIMHYPATADSYNNAHTPVFQETNSCPACMPGRATTLSSGDIATVKTLYPAPRQKSSATKRN